MGKRVLIIFTAIAVLCAGLWLAQRLVMPKYQTKPLEGSLTAEYYAETMPHDVLFVGDCEVFSNFSPVTLYQEYGITSYIRGSAQQLVWQSYYLLEDALNTDSPRVVVYNVLALKYGEPQNEAYNRMTLDGMRWGAAKAGAIRASMTEGEDPVSYLFPLLRFHSRWSELTEEDFRCMFSRKPVSHAGYLIRADIRPVTRTPAPAPLTDPHLPASSMEWLGKMTALCREKGIELVLIKSPSIEPYWYDEWDRDVKEFAETHGLWYINMIRENGSIGIDFSQDTCDMGQHLNIYGAEKLSVWFGAKLLERYELKDRRNETAFSEVWKAKTERYEKEKAEKIAEQNLK